MNWIDKIVEEQKPQRNEILKITKCTEPAKLQELADDKKWERITMTRKKICCNCGCRINENQSLCTSCEKIFAEEEEREYNSCECCGTSIELGETLCDKCKGDLHEEYINAGYGAP